MKVILCGIGAYAVWFVAGAGWLNDIVLYDTSNAPLNVWSGKIVAVVVGLLMLLLPVMSAKKYHQDYTEEIQQVTHTRTAGPYLLICLGIVIGTLLLMKV